METTNEFKNIPQGLVGTDGIVREDKHVSVSFFQEGYLTLTNFAVLQLVHGALLIENPSDHLRGKFTPAFTVLSKLTACLLPVSGEPTNGPCVISVSRAELLHLKTFLELRMKHCEKESDERSERFNPDSYIAQKLLLIDIRELLLGDISC